MSHVYIILAVPGIDLPRHSPFTAFCGPGAMIFFDPPHPSPDERTILTALALDPLIPRVPGQYRYQDDHPSMKDLVLVPLEVLAEVPRPRGGPPAPRRAFGPPPRVLGRKGRP